jgi:hypothetical protein
MRTFTVAIATLACAASLSPASAEPATATTHIDQTIAVNPVFPFFGTLNLEYEHGLADTPVTIGLSGWYEFRDVKARWLYGKALYYLRGTALRGAAIGITGGVLRAYSDPDDADTMDHDTTPTAGAMVQYNGVIGDWLVVGFGIGAASPCWTSTRPRRSTASTATFASCSAAPSDAGPPEQTLHAGKS